MRLFNATNGSVVKEFMSVPIAKGTLAKARPSWAPKTVKNIEVSTNSEPPISGKVVALELQPSQIKITSPNDYAQLLVTAHLDSGDTADVTRLVKFTIK